MFNEINYLLTFVKNSSQIYKLKIRKNQFTKNPIISRNGKKRVESRNQKK